MRFPTFLLPLAVLLAAFSCGKTPDEPADPEHVTLTVLDKEKDEKHIFDLASGGFSSTVRLAKSNADMWVPILTQNRDNVLRVIDTYIEKMTQFREAIADFDEERTRSLIEEANRIKKIIR